MKADRPVVVVGATGRLGGALCEALAARRQACFAPGRAELDLCRPQRVAEALQALGPAVVINAAAFNEVDAAEDPRRHEQLYRVNRDGPAALAEACAGLGAALVHLSTDYVFDGARETPYREGDRPQPLQEYGRSKLAGELAVLGALPTALVVRTSTLFGGARDLRPSYVDGVLAQARRGTELAVASTPLASPTYAPDLAHALLDLLAAGACGRVHAVNSGSCSRLELAREVVRLAGLADRVRVIEAHGRTAPARRPPYSVLDTSRLRQLIGRELRSWREALADYLGHRLLEERG